MVYILVDTFKPSLVIWVCGDALYDGKRYY